MCPGDTTVQILQMFKAFMSCSTTSPTVIVRKQNKCLARAGEVPLSAARFRPGYWCFCGPGSEKTWKYNAERPKLALKMIKRIYHQQAPSVQVFEHSSNRCIDEANERRSCWNACQKRAKQSSHARDYAFGVQSTLFNFCSELIGFLTRCPFRFEPPLSN